MKQTENRSQTQYMQYLSVCPCRPSLATPGPAGGPRARGRALGAGRSVWWLSHACLVLNSTSFSFLSPLLLVCLAFVLFFFSFSLPISFAFYSTKAETVAAG